MILKGETKGFDEFQKLLNQLPKNVEKRVLQKSTSQAMRDVVLKPIKAKAPRHARGSRSQASQKYGTLLSNIRVARLRKVAKGSKGARISTGRAFWGAIIERGSRYIPANPWFAPTFRSLEQRLINALGRNVGTGLEQEAKKLYKGK